MKKKIFIIIICILLLIILAFFVIGYFKEGEEKPLPDNTAEEHADLSSINFSRVSLFNSSVPRLSMNIPELWEGRYRLREEGGSAKFYYLETDSSTKLLWKIHNKEKENTLNLCETNGGAYYLEELEEETDLEYYKELMKLVISSAKCQK